MDISVFAKDGRHYVSGRRGDIKCILDCLAVEKLAARIVGLSKTAATIDKSHVTALEQTIRTFISNQWYDRITKTQFETQVYNIRRAVMALPSGADKERLVELFNSIYRNFPIEDPEGVAA